MEGISDIRIIGIDDKRRPRIMKEPYINLYFTLSHKAPAAWCADFNRLLSKHKYSTRINEGEGLYIETWVRDPEDIPAHLAEMKEAVSRCNVEYIEKVNAATMRANPSEAKEGGAQGRLNDIIAGLKFD